jgi:hypothetical protein
LRGNSGTYRLQSGGNPDFIRLDTLPPSISDQPKGAAVGEISASDARARVVYAFDPVLLLFGDDKEGLARGRAAAMTAGCRVAAEVSIADGPARLDEQLKVDVALVMAKQSSDALDALLERVGGEARRGRMRAVIAAPAAMIDALFAADLPEPVEHLIDPDMDALESAMALAGEPTPERLNDLNGASLLQQLSEEAARIASALASLSEEGGAEPSGGDADQEDVDAAFVRGIIRARRLRDHYFGSEIFADPGFDMLLDLYAARLEGGRVAVSSLCIAAAVPATTALRWIRALTEQGLFVRQADPQDGRRVYIALSDEAAKAMRRYLDAVQRSGGIAL